MKKLILTESDKKQIIAQREKAIIENFAKTFNSIKRIDENEISNNLVNSLKEKYQNGVSVRAALEREGKNAVQNRINALEVSKREINVLGRFKNSTDLPDVGQNDVASTGNLLVQLEVRFFITGFYNGDLQAELSEYNNLITILNAKIIKNKNELDKQQGIEEDLNKTITTGTGWDAKQKNVSQGNLELQSISKQIYSLFKKEGANPSLITNRSAINKGETKNNVVILAYNDTLTITIQGVNDPMSMANKYGPMIVKQFPNLKLVEKPKAAGWGEGVEFSFSLPNGQEPRQQPVAGQQQQQQQQPPVNEAELLEENWKSWVVGGLLTLSSIAGVYKFNQDKIEQANATTELYHKIKPSADKLTPSERQDILISLKSKGLLNVSYWPSNYHAYVMANFMKNNPGESGEKFHKASDEAQKTEQSLDAMSIEKVVSEHPEMFGISNAGKLILLDK